MVMVAQSCKYTKTTELYTLKKSLKTTHESFQIQGFLQKTKILLCF